ncbi:MAG: hypothetical protein ABI222_04970 [Opitutaceae bacterium]
MKSNHPDEDVTLLIDASGGVILLKAMGTFGDPVELTAEEARELAAQLTLLAEELD